MNVARRAATLKPFDASWVPFWQEPLWVTVNRQKGGVQEAIMIPAGVNSDVPQSGMGYTRAEVLALNEWLMSNAGAGLYQFQVVGADEKTWTWHTQIGPTTPPAPPQPTQFGPPIGAGVHKFGQTVPNWASPTWQQPPMWAPPAWGQPQPQQNDSVVHMLLTKLLNDRDEERKAKQQNDPMPMVMLTLQQQGQAFDQRMQQFALQNQQSIQALMQMMQGQKKGMDFDSLIEKLPILLPIVLPLLRRDDSSKEELAQLKMAMELERERRAAEARVEALNQEIRQTKQDLQNGKNSSETMQLLQLLQNQHASELKIMEERQRSIESKVPGWAEMLSLFQAMKPQDNPVIDGMRQLFEMAMAHFGGGGERGLGEAIIDGVKEITGKAIEAKAMAAAMGGIQAPPQQPMPRPSGELSGAPQAPPPQPQQQPQQQVPSGLALIQQTIANLQQGAIQYVQTEGVSGLSPEELALHLDEFAQKLEEAGIKAENVPVLQRYRDGQARIDRDEQPFEFWGVLLWLLPNVPQEYQQEVYQALIDLRRGGEESEQGEQDEESGEEGGEA